MMTRFPVVKTGTIIRFVDDNEYWLDTHCGKHAIVIASTSERFVTLNSFIGTETYGHYEYEDVSLIGKIEIISEL